MGVPRPRPSARACRIASAATAAPWAAARDGLIRTEYPEQDACGPT